MRTRSRKSGSGIGSWSQFDRCVKCFTAGFGLLHCRDSEPVDMLVADVAEVSSDDWRPRRPDDSADDDAVGDGPERAESMLCRREADVADVGEVWSSPRFMSKLILDRELVLPGIDGLSWRCLGWSRLLNFDRECGIDVVDAEAAEVDVPSV